MRVLRRRTVKTWGCGISLTLLLAAMGLLCREIVLRASPEPPRTVAKPLPRTKPPSVEHWDNAAVELLEQNERALQSAYTLEAQIERTNCTNFNLRYSRTICLAYARPNRLRFEQAEKGRQESLHVSDGWLEWYLWSGRNGPGTYSCGFGFPDGRGLSQEPLAGFFPKGAGWGVGDLSFAEQVRSALKSRRLQSLTLVSFDGKPRVVIEFRGARPSSWSFGETVRDITTLDFDSHTLPTRVEESRLLWLKGQDYPKRYDVPQYIWVPQAQLQQTTYAIRSLKLDTRLAPGTFVMTVPPGARSLGDTKRWEKLFTGFVTLRGWALPG
ncbi:hypothetical protein [Armatimonas sp.]|uniref:hypothetical protein n=1 Tax=Armatimonas sp. TaxID=1872638 RepID=UPI00286CE0AE|nr:hypothetical protein [Armatimonas sp.]